MLPIRLSSLALLAALSACDEQAAEGPERKTAAGEVLGGSITDEMLPLDTVQSQSPAERGASDSAATGDDEEGEAEPAPRTTATAAATAAPTAEASASPAADDDEA